MKHLLLVLDGPLQAWGGTAPFLPERPTETMPTLSGVVGLIANALGWHRSADLAGLVGADMHVRADRPGSRIEDYHTVGGGDSQGGVPVTGKGKKGRSKGAVITRRHYLADAAFVVHWTPRHDGISAEEIASALRAPRRALYLGRRSCPPALPPLLAITDIPADEAFGLLPLLRDSTVPAAAPGDYLGEVQAAADSAASVRVACQSPGRADEPGSEARHDVPTIFGPALRWQQSSHRWISNYTLECASTQHGGRGRQGIHAMAAALQKAANR